MQPTRCYTIWFSQRTGSTLLYKALSSTGVAGKPAEWLNHRKPDATSLKDIQEIWNIGTTDNGVFGLKVSPHRVLNEWIDTFRMEFQLSEHLSRPKVWEAAFPGGKHIFMTRRNKVRLAVSWWRAIVSGEWHRLYGQKPGDSDIADKYSFDAINHLFAECSMREAAMQSFFSEDNIIPLTIVYEDFILGYEGTVRQVLDYLNVPTKNVSIAPPVLDRLADNVSEEWVHRFREERQTDWINPAW